MPVCRKPPKTVLFQAAPQKGLRPTDLSQPNIPSCPLANPKCVPATSRLGTLSDRNESPSDQARLPPRGSGIGALHLGYSQFVVLIPLLLTKRLSNPMFGLRFPSGDRRFIGPIRHRNPNSLRIASALNPQIARHCPREFGHPIRGFTVAVVFRGSPVQGSPRREDNRVVRRLGCHCKSIVHVVSLSVREPLS